MIGHDQRRLGLNLIYTNNGIFFDFDNPTLRGVTVDGLARALGNLCRYTGHVESFYSVAQHSVEVAWRCSERAKLWALFHDAHEAYTGDISTPYKRHLQCTKHGDLTNQLDEQVRKMFAVPYDWSITAEVDRVDRAVLELEVYSPLIVGYDGPPSPWGMDKKPSPPWIHPLPPDAAAICWATAVEGLLAKCG